MTERVRDIVTGELTLDYFVRRSAEGWHLASIEWVREASTAKPNSASAPRVDSDVPYGLQFAEGGMKLEENPFEMSVLLIILEQIVQERRITDIAAQLNLRGYHTRDGAAWNAADVFNLMPRLIETGPGLLKSAEWRERRPTH